MNFDDVDDQAKQLLETVDTDLFAQMRNFLGE